MKTLRDINPGAAEMWAYDLNGDMTPDNVSGSSEKTAYFRCLNNPKHLFDRKICKIAMDTMLVVNTVDQMRRKHFPEKPISLQK